MANENKKHEDGASNKTNIVTDVDVVTNDKASVTIHTSTGDHSVVVHRRGGETIPDGGFRGGGQDIPTGHQSGYGGASGQTPNKETAMSTSPKAKTSGAAPNDAKEAPPVQPGPRAEAEEKQVVETPQKDCFETYRAAGDYAVTTYKAGGEEAIKNFMAGFDKAKECGQQKELQTEEEPEGNSWKNTARLGVIILLALLGAWFVFSQEGCMGGSDMSENTEEKEQTSTNDGSTESSSEGGAGMDETNQGEGFAPEPNVDNTPTQAEPQLADTEAPSPVTYGGLLIADEKLVMRVYNDITKDKMNLRLEASDKLDGEPKEQLLAAMISTLFANGQRVVFLNDELEIRDFDYTAYGSVQVRDIVSEQAHHIVSFGKYWASQRPESFNAWANIAFDELKRNAKTDFSVATSRTLDVLNAALKASGHTEFNDIKVVIDENRVARGKALIVEHIASKPRKQLAARAPPTTKKSATTLPSPTSSWRHIGAYYSPVPPPKSKRERDVRGVKPRVGLNRPHHGHDIARASGTPIFSTSKGKVIKRGYQVNAKGKGYGNYLVIYDGKYIWRYAHMKSRSVHKGDIVQAGQQIGTVGDTGSPGSFHLHIECWTPVEYYKKEKGGKNATPISKKLWQ